MAVFFVKKLFEFFYKCVFTIIIPTLWYVFNGGSVYFVYHLLKEVQG